MKKKSSVFYEILLALVIAALILLPQLIGTTTVTDDSAGVDEKGCPVTSMTLEDLEAPGTRFGTMTVLEWENAIRERFPQGELRHYNSSANIYAGLDAGTPKKRALQKEHLKKAPGNRSTPKTERPKNGASGNRFYSETVFIQKPE